MITAAQAACSLDATDELTCTREHQVQYCIPSGKGGLKSYPQCILGVSILDCLLLTVILFQQMSAWLKFPSRMRDCKSEASWNWRKKASSVGSPWSEIYLIRLPLVLLVYQSLFWYNFLCADGVLWWVTGARLTVGQTEVARRRTGRRPVSAMQLNLTGTIPKATRTAGHTHTVKFFYSLEHADWIKTIYCEWSLARVNPQLCPGTVWVSARRPWSRLCPRSWYKLPVQSHDPVPLSLHWLTCQYGCDSATGNFATAVLTGKGRESLCLFPFPPFTPRIIESWNH